MRARSTAYIRQNPWLLAGVLTLATGAAAALRWGTAAATLGCLLGILLMWKSDEGRMAALMAEAEAEEA